jgi:hypothetical protein
MQLNVSSHQLDPNRIALFLATHKIESQITLTLCTVGGEHEWKVEPGLTIRIFENNIETMKHNIHLLWPYLSTVYGCKCAHITYQAYSGCLLDWPEFVK